ncbi:MAG: flagellar filament capping protein FliD [Desulfovibrio sp.]
MADTYWSGNINFAGLGNGTDFPKLIDGLMKVEGTQKRRMERWRKSWVSKSDELKKLNTMMLGLRTKLTNMDTPGEFLGKKISSSDSHVVSVTATGKAAFESHKVEVKQLAKVDHWSSTGVGFDSEDTDIAPTDSKFTLSYAGKPVTINVPKGTKLKGFISLFNNHADLRGKVKATATSDGDKFFIRLNGMDLGEKNKIQVTESTIPNLSTSSFVNIQNAQDAMLKVDGFPAGSDKWMKRTTNSVSDAIEGLTLNLKSAKPGTEIDITISHDAAKTKETVLEFLKGLNEIRTQIQALTKVGKDKGDKVKGSILTGNYGVEMVSQKLKSITSSPGLGFEFKSKTNSDPYSALAAIGVKTKASQESNAFGQLILDEVEFDKALEKDPAGVAALFVTDHKVSSNSADFTTGDIIKGVTKAGKHQVQYQVSGGKIVSATINGKPASVSGWQITAMGKTKATGLSVTVNNHANGTYNGDVNIRLGKIHEMLDEVTKMTNAQTGTLKVIENNYSAIIKSIDGKIDRETKRLEVKKRSLKNKFARLDTQLGKYKKLQQQVTSQMAKLAKS